MQLLLLLQLIEDKKTSGNSCCCCCCCCCQIPVHVRVVLLQCQPQFEHAFKTIAGCFCRRCTHAISRNASITSGDAMSVCTREFRALSLQFQKRAELKQMLEYTLFLIDDSGQSFAVIALKPVDQNCNFLTARGCCVHPNRDCWIVIRF